MIRTPHSRLETADFDLHGIVGVRCVDATARDAAAVARQLGPIRATLEREPDILIRFVDRLEPPSRLRYLGLDDVAFSDDAFFVLRGKHKSRTKVRIPFEAIGGPCEIVCERGVAAVPHLIDVVNATALAGRTLPLHAAAFNYEGRGVLVTGWSKGGKTEALLAFMANGARYVGDEWVYLEEGGRRMFGIPEPIRVWSWHLEHLPAFRARLHRRERLRLRVLSAAAAAARRAIGDGRGQSAAPRRLLTRVLPLLEQQLHVNWAPADIFGAEALALSGVPDRVVFVASHESPETTVEPLSPEEVADRMAFSLQEERARFMTCYRKFRFAFPDRVNDFIEGADPLQRALLGKALEGRPAYAVYHPYPVALPALYEAIRSVL